jgi:hypothetical protein
LRSFIAGNHGELYIGVGGNTNAGVPSSIMENSIEGFLSGAILVANMGKQGFNGIIKYSAANDGVPVEGYG